MQWTVYHLTLYMWSEGINYCTFCYTMVIQIRFSPCSPWNHNVHWEHCAAFLIGGYELYAAFWPWSGVLTDKSSFSCLDVDCAPNFDLHSHLFTCKISFIPSSWTGINSSGETVVTADVDALGEITKGQGVSSTETRSFPWILPSLLFTAWNFHTLLNTILNRNLQPAALHCAIRRSLGISLSVFASSRFMSIQVVRGRYEVTIPGEFTAVRVIWDELLPTIRETRLFQMALQFWKAVPNTWQRVLS